MSLRAIANQIGLKRTGNFGLAGGMRGWLGCQRKRDPRQGKKLYENPWVRKGVELRGCLAGEAENREGKK